MNKNNNNMIAIDLNSIELNFSELDQQFSVFRNLTLEIKKSEKIGIFGPSGSGKTSLFFMIMKLIRPNKGIIKCNGKIFLIPQFPILDPWLTCYETLEYFDRSNIVDKNKILEDVKLLDQKHQIISTLSGGEKQRLNIASAISSGCDIILADEPFGRLDIGSAVRVKRILFDLVQRKDITLILASHNQKHLEDTDKIYEIRDFNLIPQ